MLKSRQLGLSTVTGMYAIWLAIFHRDKNILIIATKQAVAVNLVKKVKTALKNLPPWLLMPEIKSTTRQHVEFSNGSTIKAIPTSEDAGRSEALSLLIIDEAAFIRNFDELWTGLYSTLSTGGRAIVLSTPNGASGQYHKLYVEAEEDKNGFNPIKLMWDVHPERDQAWFDKETKGMSVKAIAQELMCDFTSSGETYLPAELLEKLRVLTEQPMTKRGIGNEIWVWKLPIPGHEYIISADVARGDGADFSTFHIIDKTESEQVAEYRGKIFPDQFAELLVEEGKRYNNALICPEKNTYGWTTNKALVDLGYKNVFFKNPKDKYDASYGSVISSAIASKIGFDTQGGTKDKALTRMEEWLRNDYIRIRSTRTLDELRTFVSVHGKLKAAKGKNDDLVMALAIGCWLYEGKKQDQTVKVDFDRALLAAFSVNTRGRDIIEKYVDPKFNRRPFSPLPDHVLAVHGSKGPIEDFDWVSR